MMITSFLYNSTTFNPSMPVVPIQVRHQNRTAEVIALIDSGADATILPINILHLIRARRGDTGHMRGVTGVRKRVGIYTVTIQIDTHIMHTVHAVAADVVTEAILGRDILNHHVVILDGPAGVTEIRL
jgi:hypothetical protein